ncbi:putative thioredoxin [Herbihabitans rhizosphaerae]|uniref:Putative thioredoxin n=1 Tax=Herbihabitans rhizosphaerae TaxID=1872711 RepID=A0A4Q7KUR6_9PSEU|nr:thioredoxin family protein [Herbihabitans rhizosphaerae]RZS39242.1 putative thioredoxin [Herbihabitans rhizosphaerae]
MRKAGILAGALAIAASTIFGASVTASADELPRPGFPAASKVLEENVIEVTDANYEEVLAKSNEKLVIFDFGATWCPPCQEMKPVIDKLAKEGADAGKWILATVDVDATTVDDKYNIEYIPTLIPVRKTVEHPDSRHVGYDGDAAALEQYIKDQIAKG